MLKAELSVFRTYLLMLKLLNDEENEWNVSGLLKPAKKEKQVEELETVVKEATSDLPLGKALNLLVNIHGYAFDNATNIIQDSAPGELAIKIIDFPAVRALKSIDHYLAASDNISKSFEHIYNSLEEKFIKRRKSDNESAMRVICYLILYSEYRKEVQQSICQKLIHADKRSQLATVSLLQFLLINYISAKNGYNKLCNMLIPPLVKIVEDYGESPTLLVCSTCDLLIELIGYLSQHWKNSADISTVSSSKKIVEIDQETKSDNKSLQLSTALKSMDKVLYIMEKWNKSSSQLERASYKVIHQFIYATTVNEQDMNAWISILTYLTPKLILSEKPLSNKRQKSILCLENESTTVSYIKLAVFFIHQKDQLEILHESAQTTNVLGAEEDEIKTLLKSHYNQVIQSYPLGKEFGSCLILLMIKKLPFIFTTDDIKSAELVHLILDSVEYADGTRKSLVTIATKQPESTVCNLLLHVVQQDDMAISSYNLIKEIISEGSSEVIDILQTNLLSLIKNNTQACELLVQCMSKADLPLLIRKLMAMTTVQEEREKMTCIALISKALLQERWDTYSVLFYIELVRNVKLQKGFVQPVKPKFADLKKRSPKNGLFRSIVKNTIEDQELAMICSTLMLPIQLWSTKVREETIKDTLTQLVRKSYGIPTDSSCIEAWKQLSFAFLNQHNFVWVVIKECLSIMKSQPAMTKGNEVVLYLRLNPMLILQTIPKEAYQVVNLPKSYFHLLEEKLTAIGIDINDIKVSNNNKGIDIQLSIELMDELLDRCLKDDGSTISFSIGLIKKLFCT